MHGRAYSHAGAILLAASIVNAVRVLPLSLPNVPPSQRAQLQYAGADGRRHVYLGDYDSYLWIRHARNVVKHGESCDRVERGTCMDALAAAPVGRPSPYARSLHVWAIAGLHRLITFAVPDYPLPASAYWLPVLVGVLGVLPAFAVGAALGGTVGGFAAAVVIGVNPLYLSRSVGSDNDVWNVVLPLYAIWAALAALRAAATHRRMAYAALAGFVVSLHAATWSGWIFGYAVVLTGLGASLALRVLDTLRRGGPLRRRAGDAALVFATFVGVSVVGTMLAGAGAEYQRLIAWLFAPLAPSAALSPAASLAWPNVLATVGELATPSLRSITGLLEGQRYFFVAWLGLLLAVLPRRGWRWGHYVAFLAGIFVYRWMLTAAASSPRAVTTMLAVPLAFAAAVSLAVRRVPWVVPRSGGLLVVAWFLSALLQAYAGVRFVLLLVPPFGLLFGLTLGRLHAWLGRMIPPRLGARGVTLRAGLVVAVALAVLSPVQRGLTAGRRYVPRMNDAWWDTLERLRDTTPPDAIVTTWWDYGHWVKYVAERRTSADGSTLLTRVPHWIGRLLLARPPESVGLLRMLACGSDTDASGAYGQLLAAGLEAPVAYQSLVTIASLDGGGARELLVRELEVSPQAADGVLAASHCDPPPVYLVLSSELIGGSAWRRLGAWDPLRAWVASAPGNGSSLDLKDALVRRFSRPEADATALLEEWAAARSDAAAEHFVTPRYDYLVPEWQRCRAERAGAWECPLGRPIDRAGSDLVAVRYLPGAPGSSRVVLRRAGTPVEAEPAALLIAGATKLREFAFPAPADPRLGVLIDEPLHRVLVGAPTLLRSTFTRLMFLDGRFAAEFEKVDERRGYRGERVVTWRTRSGRE